MKSLVILIPIFLFLSTGVFSQDTIYMRSNDIVVAKVLEILPEYVKYKKFDNPDGPDYTTLKADILRIVYQNGTVDEFKDSDIPHKSNNESIEKKIHGIFLAGITMSTLGADAKNTQNKTGLAAGFGIDFPFDRSENYFELTLYYEEKGANYSDFEGVLYDEEYLFTETVLDIEYLTLSFLYKRFFGVKKLFYAKAGLYAGYRISGELNSKLIRLSDNYENFYTASLEDTYSKWEAGATFGAGINIPVTKGKFPTNLVFETRYNLGLTNIFIDGDSAQPEDKRETNQNLSFLAGLRFPF